MHMIDVLDKLKEIQENYDNEDIQRAITTAAKMNPVEEEAVAEGEGISHSCATHFTHEKFGEGTVIHGEHTLSEGGEVSHYDAKFVKEDGSPFIVRNIPVANMHETVVVEHSHQPNKRKRAQLYLGKFDEEVVDEGHTSPELQDILDKHKDAYMKFKAGAELHEPEMEEFYDDLYEYFTQDIEGGMPYGTAKGRTGDPYDYISNELDNIDNSYAVGENTVEEVHEEVNDELADIIKLAGRNSVLGLSQNTIIAESTELSEEDELEEGQSLAQKAAFEKMIAAKNGNKVEADSDSDDADKDKEALKDSVDEDCNYREEAIEETVEVPLSELADLLRLAGYENYEEKLSEYENEPEEEYFDVEHQLIGLAGGLNRPKIMHPTVAGGDNPMAVIPVKVDEEEDMVEKIYQNYRSFVDEAMQEQCSTNK